MLLACLVGAAKQSRRDRRRPGVFVVRGSRRELLGGAQRRVAPCSRREDGAKRVPLLDAASSTGTRAIPWANRGSARWATAPPPLTNHYARWRSSSNRAIDLARRAASDVAFGRRNDRALHEDVPGVGEGNGVLNAGFLGQAPYDCPDVLKVRDAGPAGWMRGGRISAFTRKQKSGLIASSGQPRTAVSAGVFGFRQ